MKTKKIPNPVISMRIPPETKDALLHISFTDNVDLNTVMKDAFNTYIEAREVRERSERVRARLIGA